MKEPAEYTIVRYGGDQLRRYKLVSPAGVELAFGMTYRTARKIADSLNTTRWQG